MPTGQKQRPSSGRKTWKDPSLFYPLPVTSGSEIPGQCTAASWRRAEKKAGGISAIVKCKEDTSSKSFFLSRDSRRGVRVQWSCCPRGLSFPRSYTAWPCREGTLLPIRLRRPRGQLHGVSPDHPRERADIFSIRMRRWLGFVLKCRPEGRDSPAGGVELPREHHRRRPASA